MQEAQSRFSALVGIQRDNMDYTMSLTPPMPVNNAATLQAIAAASRFGLLSQEQLIEVNRHAAAAFLASQMPIQTFYPHPIINNWSPQMLSNTTTLHSPPASPPRPVTPPPTNKPNSNKHLLSSPTSISHLEPMKKLRKLTHKKEHQTANNFNNNNNETNHKNKNNNNNNNNNNTNNKNRSNNSINSNSNGASRIELSMNVNDLFNTHSGSITPPSSGSSPNLTPESQNGNTSGNSKDSSRDKSFTCKTCSRSFGYKHVLQNHERTHTGEKPFECPECHKRFTRDHHLKTHMRLHTGEKPYHCSHCDRQFVQVANLRRHLRVHTGERPYICEICDGKYSDSNQLKSHMLVHNDEKPFECERCHTKFRRRHHLLNHKCGILSPPTPSTSPSISVDSSLVEHNTSKSSNNSSCSSSSEGSVDLNKSLATELTEDGEEAPMDLSEENAITTDATINSSTLGRSGKAEDIRQIFPLPYFQSHNLYKPVQTEPEDLSMHSPRTFGSILLLESMKTAAAMHLLAKGNCGVVDDNGNFCVNQKQKLRFI